MPNKVNPDRATIFVRIPEGWKSLLAQIAREEYRTVSSVVKSAIADYLKARKPKR